MTLCESFHNLAVWEKQIKLRRGIARNSLVVNTACEKVLRKSAACFPIVDTVCHHPILHPNWIDSKKTASYILSWIWAPCVSSCVPEYCLKDNAILLRTAYVSTSCAALMSLQDARNVSRYKQFFKAWKRRKASSLNWTLKRMRAWFFNSKHTLISLCSENTWEATSG